MVRVLVLALAGLAVAVPTALAAYPSPYAAQGDAGVQTVDGTAQLFAQKAAFARTTIQLVRGGEVAKARTIRGEFGIPMVTSNVPGGMFRDGKTFMLQSVGSGGRTTFKLVDTKTLKIRDTIPLKGTFAYDALSPNGKTLYLVQHTSRSDIEHYIVRAYDLRSHALRKGRIADKTQRSWIMRGWPITRATTANGRWVYTMYLNPGGYPFVHALDTVKGVAHCVGFAWPTKNQPDLIGYKLALDGGTLHVVAPSGAVWRSIDLATWKVAT